MKATVCLSAVIILLHSDSSVLGKIVKKHETFSHHFVKQQSDCRLGPEPTDSGLSGAPDPAFFPYGNAFISDDTIGGNFTIRDAKIVGLSSVKFWHECHNNYSLLTFNATIQDFSITANYEVKKGYIDTPVFGTHTFSGKGRLNITLPKAGAWFIGQVTLRPDSDYLGLGFFLFEFDVPQGDLWAENLVVDGKPVEWLVVNNNFQYWLEKLRLEVHEYVVREVAEILEECTLRDLIMSCLRTYSPPNL